MDSLEAILDSAKDAVKGVARSILKGVNGDSLNIPVTERVSVVGKVVDLNNDHSNGDDNRPVNAAVVGIGISF